MTHIADYTTEDLAAGILGMHDMSHKEMVAKATKAINATIAAAVAAEREACANVEPGMDTNSVLGWDTMTPDERRMWKAGYGCAMGDFSAAIRARNDARRE